MVSARLPARLACKSCLTIRVILGLFYFNWRLAHDAPALEEAQHPRLLDFQILQAVLNILQVASEVLKAPLQPIKPSLKLSHALIKASLA